MIRILSVPFPLTPALFALGERGPARPLPLRQLDSRERLPSILPLPKGEGWGEGEGTHLSPATCRLTVIRTTLPSLRSWRDALTDKFSSLPASPSPPPKAQPGSTGSRCYGRYSTRPGEAHPKATAHSHN